MNIYSANDDWPGSLRVLIAFLVLSLAVSMPPRPAAQRRDHHHRDDDSR